MSAKYVLLIIGLIFLCFGSVLVFTQPAFISAFDLTGKGEIGDTIGGITAPLINLVGAILVFMSFREQFRANQLQTQSLREEINNNIAINNFNSCLGIFKDLKGEFGEMTVHHINVVGGVRPTDVILHQDFKHRDFPLEAFELLEVYLSTYTLFMRRLLQSNMNHDDKVLLYNYVINHNKYALHNLPKIRDKLIKHVDDNYEKYKKTEKMRLSFTLTLVVKEYFSQFMRIVTSNSDLVNNHGVMFKRSNTDNPR